MAVGTEIEWTHPPGYIPATWNPATGCTKVSPGCAHCYIERTPPFRIHHRKFVKGTTGISLHPDRLSQPLRWRKPHCVFVNSLSDLFHEDIPPEFICKIFAVMALTPQHIYQVLTKRPARMLEYATEEMHNRIIGRAWEMLGHPPLDKFEHKNITKRPFPLPNVWLGVTAESQRYADERIPLLLETPAALRFVSYEPALSALRLKWEWVSKGKPLGGGPRCNLSRPWEVPQPKPAIDWLICGAESGPKARPMDLVWARDARDQCGAAGVAFFMKQICERGRKVPFDQWPQDLQVREFPQIGPIAAWR